MGKFDECQRPFSHCWCESRPNNPHCKSVIPSVPINDNSFLIMLFVAGTILILIKLKIIKMKTLFKKVSTFLWGEKSFRWGELKGL